MSVTRHLAEPTPAVELVDTPCKGRGDLFTSTLVEHHVEAREHCVICPGRRICLAAAELEPYAEGTYGGALFVNGEERYVDGGRP